MRSWWVAVMLVPALAGCAGEGVPAGVPVLEFKAPGSAVAEYSFVVYGKPLVEDADRTVQVKIYADGDPVPDYILEYEAKREGGEVVLAVIRSSSPYLRFDVIAERQEVAHGWMDVEACPRTGGELTVAVKDHRLHGDRNVELTIRDCPS